MNLISTLRTAILLGISATALIGTVTLADELADNDRIVLAKASVQADSTKQQPPGNQAINAALAAAIQGMMADNKLELDIRLSAHKSVFLTADL